MSRTYQIRMAVPEDAEAISALIVSLSSYSLANPEAPETAAPFLETVAPEAIRGYLEDERFRYYVAESDGEVVGVVGMRDASHLYHLFVEESLHGRGLGARLWTVSKNAALQNGNAGHFTVYSSPYAVEIYRRFGFETTGPEEHKDGIASIPMELDER